MIDRNKKTKHAVLDFSGMAASSAPDEVSWAIARRSENGEEHHRTSISNDRLTIGRRPDNDLCVVHPTVSGHHAELFLVKDDMFVRDLNSTNGTLLNGRRIDSVAGLADGDVLHFGQVLFSVLKDESAADLQRDFSQRTCISSVPADAVLHKGFDDLLNRPDVVPYFQPIVRLCDAEVQGYEVLIRSKVAGLETPDKMFRIAAMRMAEAKLSEICRSAGMLHAMNLDRQSTYYVNTHPAELETVELLRSLEELRCDYPDLRIVLEIHEAAITSLNYLHRLVDILHDLDIQLAYDDFGSGQARLTELFEVPPDVLKFDISFVQGLEAASRQRLSSVRSLLQIVKELNVRSLAEGIETAEQAETCAAVGFELAQGYFFGRPQPREHWVGAPHFSVESAAEVPSEFFKTVIPTESGD